MTRFIQLITLSSVLPIMMGGGCDEQMQPGLGMDGKVRITASNFSYCFYFLGLYNKQDETNGKSTKKESR